MTFLPPLPYDRDEAADWPQNAGQILCLLLKILSAALILFVASVIICAV